MLNSGMLAHSPEDFCQAFACGDCADNPETATNYSGLLVSSPVRCEVDGSSELSYVHHESAMRDPPVLTSRGLRISLALGPKDAFGRIPASLHYWRRRQGDLLCVYLRPSNESPFLYERPYSIPFLSQPIKPENLNTPLYTWVK